MTKEAIESGTGETGGGRAGLEYTMIKPAGRWLTVLRRGLWFGGKCRMTRLLRGFDLVASEGMVSIISELL
jgi:hypothetical protein